MKSLMTLVFLIPMICAAVPSRAETRTTEAADLGGYRPEPFPRYCPEGTRRVFDEYRGRYICVPNDDYGPRPLPWPPREDRRGGRFEEMKGILGGDDMSAKSEALNGLFDAMNAGEVKDAVASSPRSSGSSLKPSAGALKFAHTDPSVPVPQTGKPRPGENGVRFMTVGAIDDLGNKLRDRNDKKLEEATKQQKETEKRWKDYKDGKSVSPHPPTADEIILGGKG